MPFDRRIRHILLGTLASLALVGAAAAYWAIAGPETLLLREDNPRIVEALARIQRGAIYDRHNRLLAETTASDSALLRRYLSPSTYSLAGYYSLRYGVGGAEAAYDEALAGARPLETLADYFNIQVLRLPQIGADIMLSVDADIHEALGSAMAGESGAAIVMKADSGAILALISTPSFDPNRLDEDWSELIQAEGKPFFNRALQGNYQLGGNIYALWLAQAIATDFELSLRFTGATEPVILDDDTAIHCVIQPISADLTLPEALRFSCPAPFKSYRQMQSASSYDELIATYRFSDPVVLPGFPEPEQLPPPTTTAELEPASLELRNTLGQGIQTTTPLHLATIISAIANDGVALTPWIHAGTGQPGADTWLQQPSNSESFRMLDADTASQLRSRLRDVWDNLNVRASQASIEVGAYLAMSRSGDESQLWLNGYVAPEDEVATAFVILLEDSADASKLLAIGNTLIEALS